MSEKPHKLPKNYINILNDLPSKNLKRHLQSILRDIEMLPQVADLVMNLYVFPDVLESKAYMQAFATMIQQLYNIPMKDVKEIIISQCPQVKKYFVDAKNESSDTYYYSDSYSDSESYSESAEDVKKDNKSKKDLKTKKEPKEPKDSAQQKTVKESKSKQSFDDASSKKKGRPPKKPEPDFVPQTKNEQVVVKQEPATQKVVPVENPKPKKGRIVEEPEIKCPPPVKKPKQINPAIQLWQERDQKYLRNQLQLPNQSYREAVVQTLQQFDYIPVFPKIAYSEPLSLQMFPVTHSELQNLPKNAKQLSVTQTYLYLPEQLEQKQEPKQVNPAEYGQMVEPRMSMVTDTYTTQMPETETITLLPQPKLLRAQRKIEANSVISPVSGILVSPQTVLSTIITHVNRRSNAEQIQFFNQFLNNCLLINNNVLDFNGVQSILSLIHFDDHFNCELVEGSMFGQFCYYLKAIKPINENEQLILSKDWKWMTRNMTEQERPFMIKNCLKQAENVNVQIIVPSGSQKFYYKNFYQNKLCNSVLRELAKKIIAKIGELLGSGKLETQNELTNKISIEYYYDGTKFVQMKEEIHFEDDEQKIAKKLESIENEIRNALCGYFDLMDEEVIQVYSEWKDDLKIMDLLGW
ncbi:Conserved_hypothetical protein [Hexamita inflata]|uniref:Uncharacterized protein n=1 Tax=Hexamita inflata TaxID=28002 RepID=A0AA86P1K9_9EUKA|nr:Conserved hypothetical protein [Hexamita inflata]